MKQKQDNFPPRGVGQGQGDSDKSNNKLVVRNLAFQASQKELHGLFSSFGQVKKIRIPKKNGGTHRGFAFIDFTTHQEAVNAMTALSSAHLYGRHLVIEWAKDESDDLDVLRKRARSDEKAIENSKRKSKRGDAILAKSGVEEDNFDEDM